MPWNSQGGGGWQGGGGPGPWGGRPGGGQQPPDLEELLRRSQEKVKSLFPGGGPSERRPQGPASWSGSRSWACGWPAASTRSSRTSRAWSRASASSIAPPRRACNYHLPAPIEAVEKVPVTRVNRIEIGFRSAGQPTDGADHGRRARRQRRGADADRRREHHRHQLRRALEDRQRRRLPVQRPRPREHGEGRGRERDARDHRPDADRRGHHRGPPRDRAAGPASSCRR